MITAAPALAGIAHHAAEMIARDAYGAVRAAQAALDVAVDAAVAEGRDLGAAELALAHALRDAKKAVITAMADVHATATLEDAVYEIASLHSNPHPRQSFAVRLFEATAPADRQKALKDLAWSTDVENGGDDDYSDLRAFKALCDADRIMRYGA